MRGMPVALLIVSVTIAAHASAFESAKVIAATGTIEYAFTPGTTLQA